MMKREEYEMDYRYCWSRNNDNSSLTAEMDDTKKHDGMQVHK